MKPDQRDDATGFESLRSVGFAEEPVTHNGSVDDQVYQSWYQYLTKTLGRSPECAQRRAEAEVTREHARQWIERLIALGWPLKGMKILDIGSGHGTLAIELALAGAKVTALEPCDAWREISMRRTTQLGLTVHYVAGDAEAIPFANAAFDGCVSLQVLEHVPNPRRVVREISRVLKYDGRCLVSCENYLAFREQHYGVFWLPALPRALGGLYLSARGRDPQFLRKHITYTYWPALAKCFVYEGLWHHGWRDIYNLGTDTGAVRSRAGRAAFRIVRILCGVRLAQWCLICLRARHRMFCCGFVVNGWKARASA